MPAEDRDRYEAGGEAEVKWRTWESTALRGGGYWRLYPTVYLVDNQFPMVKPHEKTDARKVN